MPKRRILLCWGYHRKGWLHSFNALNEEFNFHYLFHISKPKNEINHSLSENLHYWSDFNSAQQIIEEIKPSKIVFMSTEGIHSTGLNIVAKHEGIETLVVQHGMFHKYDDYLKLAIEENKQRSKSVAQSNTAAPVNRRFLLKFFLRSVWYYPRAILYMLRLQYLKRTLLEIEALRKLKSNYRIASKYVVFTKQNASIFVERDGVDPDRMIEVGNPEMDDFVNYIPSKKSEKNYLLLIDQSWSEVKEFNSPGFGISKQQTVDFHLKLSEYAKTIGCSLKIKLHPYSYNSDFFPKDDNIEYLKDTNVVPYIMEADGIFGFNSTLMIPSIYFNKSCLFRIWDQSDFQNEVDKLDVATVLDYHNFELADINFKAPDVKGLKAFVAKYLFRVDGNSIKRLGKVLAS